MRFTACNGISFKLAFILSIISCKLRILHHPPCKKPTCIASSLFFLLLTQQEMILAHVCYINIGRVVSVKFLNQKFLLHQGF